MRNLQPTRQTWAAAEQSGVQFPSLDTLQNFSAGLVHQLDLNLRMPFLKSKKEPWQIRQADGARHPHTDRLRHQMKILLQLTQSARNLIQYRA